MTSVTAEKSALVLPDQSSRRRESLPAAPADSTNPMQLLAIAVQQGAPIERLQQLMDLRDRWEAGEARKAFTSAMAEFKQNPPKILKDKHVMFQTSKGTTEYDHATLGGVCAAIVKGLSDVGISHRWITEQPERHVVKVTCVLTHSAGHSESTTLMSAPDDSGGKNSIQAIASAVSYLQRYTLLSATGLATNDMDDDGHGAGGEKVDLISEKQYADLMALIDEHGGDKEKARAKLLALFKLKDFHQIPAANFSTVCADIRRLAAARADAKARRAAGLAIQQEARK